MFVFVLTEGRVYTKLSNQVVSNVHVRIPSPVMSLSLHATITFRERCDTNRLSCEREMPLYELSGKRTNVKLGAIN
jgi:hypothetical protein